MKVRISVGLGGPYIEIPITIMRTMKWELGDQLKLEPVVNRDGTVSHLVVEKV